MWIRALRAAVAGRTNRVSGRAPCVTIRASSATSRANLPMDDELIALLLGEPDLLRLCLLARAVSDPPDRPRPHPCPAVLRTQATPNRGRWPCHRGLPR